MTSQPTNLSQQRGGSLGNKAARATFAKNTINHVIPHILQNNSRARLGNESTEKIYYSPSMMKIKAKVQEELKDPNDIDEEGFKIGGQWNAGSSSKGKITGFFKPIQKVQKSEDAGEAGSHVQKGGEQMSLSDQSTKISDVKLDNPASSSQKPISHPSSSSSDPNTSTTPSKPQPKITVVQSDTLNAARAFVDPTAKNRRIAVLNMASFLRPGGGVMNGAIAQEESLCLRSTLYTALDERFYRLPKLGGLFTEDILVFRDSHNDELPKADWYYVDVISVAALKNPDLITTPDGKEVYEYEKDKEEMSSKIKLILQTALQKKSTHLVLGALGCGAYHNPPEEVAKMFRRVMMGDRHGRGKMDLAGIEEICIAIFDDGVNLRVFREVFGSAGSGVGEGEKGKEDGKGKGKSGEEVDDGEGKGKGKDVEMSGMS